MVEAQLRGGHQRRGNRGYPRVPGQLLDLRHLPPPAEVLSEGARVVAAACDLGQRAAPGQNDVDRGGRGRDLPCAEDLPDAYDAIPGEGGDGLIISKQTLHGRTLSRLAGRLPAGGQPRDTEGRLCVLVGVGEGDLEGPLVGTAHDLQLEAAAAGRREGVEQVIGCAGRAGPGRHDQVA